MWTDLPRKARGVNGEICRIPVKEQSSGDPAGNGMDPERRGRSPRKFMRFTKSANNFFGIAVLRARGPVKVPSKIAASIDDVYRRAASGWCCGPSVKLESKQHV